MTADISTDNDTRSLDRLKLIALVAVAALVLPLVAGVLLLVLEPASGSSAEAALGATAAVGGLATGVLVIAAVIYAQVRNLWQFAPIGIRIVLWVFIAVGVTFTIWNLISQPFRP